MSKVLEKFLRKRNRANNNVVKFRHLFEDNQRELLYFANHGKVERELPALRAEVARTPWLILKADLDTPRNHFERHIEAVYVKEGLLAKLWLEECLKYALVHGAICLYSNYLAATVPVKVTSGIIGTDVPFNLSIAVLLGEFDKANKLFEFLSQAYTYDQFIRSNSHMTDFMLLLYAAYSAQPMAAKVENFAYSEIVANWDTTDEDKIIAYLTRLCDDQMSQVAAPPSQCFFEFDEVNWQFIPYPALMLLALRQARGIDTPAFDHPAFGLLTDIPWDNSAKEPDPVYEPLMAKLEQQGFDMDSIFS